ALRHHRRGHPRTRPSAGGDEGRHHGHRKTPRKLGFALRAPLYDGGRHPPHGQWGDERHAHLRRDGRGVRASRCDDHRERDRALARVAHGPRIGPMTARAARADAPLPSYRALLADRARQTKSRRRAVNYVMVGASYAAAVVVALPLILILVYLLKQGASSLNW